jgi:hypothetical protein
VVGRDGLSWKTRDQARLSDRGISVRGVGSTALDHHGKDCWDILLVVRKGKHLHTGRRSQLWTGAGLGNTVRLGGGARTRGETGARFEMSLSARAAIWLEAGTGGGLGRDWQRLEDSFQGAVEGLWRCSVLSCSRKQWGRWLHPIPSMRLGETELVQYQQYLATALVQREQILEVGCQSWALVTGHWRLITGHCYSYRDDNTKYTHLTVCCTAALLRFQLPASLLENSVAHTTPYGPRATAFQK